MEAMLALLRLVMLRLVFSYKRMRGSLIVAVIGVSSASTER
jgi:hypothetical protein